MDEKNCHINRHHVCINELKTRAQLLTKSMATHETDSNLSDMSQKHSAAVYASVQKGAESRSLTNCMLCEMILPQGHVTVAPNDARLYRASPNVPCPLIQRTTFGLAVL